MACQKIDIEKLEIEARFYEAMAPGPRQDGRFTKKQNVLTYVKGECCC